MSNIYIQEPHTNGKVIIHTTSGDIAIELFSKEAPKACRNFVQLALEGYFDNTIFHRVVPGFIIQGGDPTGSGHGGESIYGGPFVDEFHTRLRFVRRGLVAMANSGKNDNRSQFFITLDRTDELQNKHTIFGKVVGETLFNVLKIGELETDENERPLYPPKIISTEVVGNPFDDIIPRITAAEKLAQETTTIVIEPRKKKLKKNVALLSFGDEASEFEDGQNLKIKSSHDLVENDPRLSKEVSVKEFEIKKNDSSAKTEKANVEQSKLQEVKDKIHDVKKRKKNDDDSDDNTDSAEEFDRKMKENIRQQQESIRLKKESKMTQLPKSEAVRQEIEQVKQDIRKLNRSREPGEEDERAKKKAKKSFVQLERQKYLSSGKAVSGKRKRGSETDTLEKLKAFLTKIETAVPSETEPPLITKEDAEPCLLHSVPNCLSCQDTFGKSQKDDTDEGWLAHQLVFEKDHKGKDLMQRRDDPNDYVVIDPLARKKQAVEEEREKRDQKGGINEVFVKSRHRERKRHSEHYNHDSGRNQSRGRGRNTDPDRYRPRDYGSGEKS
ncbi:cyclophilin-like domain-containing protein [Glomus cerebriforme]|uniref:Peptidyl-prolyl isomerase CWC27 n=1 Tax=Glomus cerebriforme TaxID=658196 RepID=A0A397SE78_9GLOM|nr:cyclophilin-like domain-containing protein [Glomus cerebriforme]